MDLTIHTIAYSISDGASVTLTAVGIALPVTMIVALLAALCVAAQAAGTAGPLVRSAGRSNRAVPPVVTGCAVAVVAIMTGASNVALVAAAAMCAINLPTATTALVEIFSTSSARRWLQAAIALGASPHYVAVAVHLRSSVRAVVAVALRTAVRMSVEAGALVVALVGTAAAERTGVGSSLTTDIAKLPFAVGQFFSVAAEPASHVVLLRSALLVAFVLLLHAIARYVEGEPYGSVSAR